MVQQERPERMATFSSHSVSFQALYEVGYWQTNMVSEDSRIFWNLLVATTVIIMLFHFLIRYQWMLTPLQLYGRPLVKYINSTGGGLMGLRIFVISSITSPKTKLFRLKNRCGSSTS